MSGEKTDREKVELGLNCPYGRRGRAEVDFLEEVVKYGLIELQRKGCVNLSLVVVVG